MQWLRGQDLNLRPSDYEPDALPGCATPQLLSTLQPRGRQAVRTFPSGARARRSARHHARVSCALARCPRIPSNHDLSSIADVLNDSYCHLGLAPRTLEWLYRYLPPFTPSTACCTYRVRGGRRMHPPPPRRLDRRVGPHPPRMARALQSTSWPNLQAVSRTTVMCERPFTTLLL